MSDILQRLRCTVPCQDMTAKAGCHCAEAADTIAALTARVEELEGLASSYLAAAAQVGGCGDGGCVVLRPTGMHTNGGCRCTQDMDRTRERGVSRLLMMAQHIARAAITKGESRE